MADTSIVNGIIEQIQTNNTTYAIASSAYGECNTAANQQVKTVAMTGFKLTPGVTIHVKFININTHNSPQLKVNTTDAKPMVEYSNQAINSISSWHEGAILTLTYDGINWVKNESTGKTIPTIKIVTWNSVT